MRKEEEDVPYGYRRPRSKNKFVDLLLDAVFNFTGPAQATHDSTPMRTGRTAKEAKEGYAQWQRVTVDGKTYLVQKDTGSEN